MSIMEIKTSADATTIVFPIVVLFSIFYFGFMQVSDENERKRLQLGVCIVIETEDMGSFVNGNERLRDDKVGEGGGEGVILMTTREIGGEVVEWYVIG